MFFSKHFAHFQNFIFLLLSVLSSFLFVHPSYASFSLDSTYGTGGKVITSFGSEAVLSKIALQSDGKAVAVGFSSNGSPSDWTIVRYNTDGTLDTGFGTNGIVINNFGYSSSLDAVAIQSDGKIIVAGTNAPGTWVVGRYNSNGTLDTTFGVNGIVTTPIAGSVTIADVTIQQDGKILAGGYIGAGVDNARVVRYNSDGSLDLTFGNGGIASTQDNGRVHSMVLQSDGKILVGGDSGRNGGSIFFIRFNADGSLDSSFGNSSYVLDQIGQNDGGNAIALQSDGKFLITGPYNSNQSIYVGRYNPNGSRDTNFGTNGFYTNSLSSGFQGINSLAIQSDGKIDLGGYTFDTSSNHINFASTRVNSDGTLDTNYGNNGLVIIPMGSSFNNINSLVLQQDGKILAGGQAYNGTYDDWALARFLVNVPPVINQIPNATKNEGATYSYTGSFTDPDSTSWTGTVDYGDGSGAHAFASPNESLNQTNQTFTISHVYKDEGTYTVTVTITDNQGATSQPATATITVNNATPTVGAISVSTNPVQINNATSATATFTDPGVLDTHTATWDWGDGSTPTAGTISESNGSGTVGADSHTYTTAGVYTITLTVTDDDGTQPGTQTFQYVSAYNPTSQGLFSAGSHFSSPAGAYSQNTSLTGTVKFGLSYKYQGTMPVGDKQFTMNFNAASLLFNATTVSSLVISNGIGTLTGTGTVNGSGTYNFLVTGSESAKTVRIQIKDSSGNVVYDTQPGAADTATPTTSVTGNVLAH